MSPSISAKIAFVLLFIAPAIRCDAASLLYIGAGNSTRSGQAEIQEAVGFYGLDLRVIPVSSAQNNSALERAAGESGLAGVAIEAGALTSVDRTVLFRVLARQKGQAIPVLILGITPDSPKGLLADWAGAAVGGCSTGALTAGMRYVFGTVPGVTDQLSGLEAPVALVPHAAGSFAAFNVSGNVDRIESLRANEADAPVFVKASRGNQPVFLACALSQMNAQTSGQDVASEFLRLAPAMIFVRFCAGDRGWHSVRNYANFTIDDPWLREPYGYVDYEGLLTEMLRHRFHTTIAFIPWNYDRSQAEVVALFKNHPAQYSISVHGNNHDHKEFTDYKSKPLEGQIYDLKQALVRMDRFSALTGIPYDKVMVFPHSIAPEPTLGGLKTYNYFATVNSTNTPENTSETLHGVEALRPVTLRFGGFPSILRYSTEVPVTAHWIAVNQFLGNPLFFYDHSALFANGIDAFDKVADAVNGRDATTEWSSLGEIAKHLYVVKERSDGDYDVQAFSSELALSNPSSRPLSFHLEKVEVGGQKIQSVTENGAPIAYTLLNGKVSLTVPVSARGTARVSIAYVNDLGSSPIQTAHDSLRVELLRRGSDFRDIYLAKVGPGLAFIRFYDAHKISPLELIVVLLILLAALMYLLVCLRRLMARSRAAEPRLSVDAR
jgi:hypothetical protein